jgi:hypothetical protein
MGKAKAKAKLKAEEGHYEPTEAEQYVLDHVPQAYKDGLELKAWYERKAATGSFDDKFDLVRETNIPAHDYGYLDTARIGGKDVKVFGDVQEQFFDQPKELAAGGKVPAGWSEQLREFVLKYFLHVSSAHQIEPVPQRTGAASHPPLAFLSACLKDRHDRGGIGFYQLAYKKKDGGKVGWFSEAEQFDFVDLTELGTKYDWVLAKARLYQFSLTIYPVGPLFPFTFADPYEHVYVLFMPEFVVDEPRVGGKRTVVDPETGDEHKVLAEYGFGFSLVQNLSSYAPVTIGPQIFDLGMQYFRFRLLEDGRISSKMVFCANQLTYLFRLNANPLVWPLRAAEALSLKLAPGLTKPLQGLIDALPLSDVWIDVVFDAVRALDVLTLGEAAKRYCISVEQIQKDVLIKHDMVFYGMIADTLRIWRQVRDWTDAAAIPAWVRFGEPAQAG